MPLSNDQHFGVLPLTEAINLIPATPTIIRESGLFTPKPLSTTYVSIAIKNGKITLVPAVPRGTPGEPVAEDFEQTQPFEILHLPKDDVVRADDVQNLRQFGTANKTVAVSAKVNDKLASMKQDIELTREHLMLGALMGKILDADGKKVLLNLYDRFGLKREVHDLNLSSDTFEVGKALDDIKTTHGKKRGGETLKGWTVFASPEFMQEFVYHKKLVELYQRFQEGKAYREGNTNVSFHHMGIDFVQYDHVFESGLQIEAGEGLLVPSGTKNTFREYFAPADMNATVNTIAKPYYASREKMKHDKGWSLHTQSNPLPLCLRPDLMATLRMS